MTLKIAINGFGRIGRNVLRALLENDTTDVEVVAINDLAPPATQVHLLKFDSVHGRLNADVTVEGDTMKVGRHEIRLTAIRNPEELPWSDVDIAYECTGLFTSREKAAMHLKNGSKRVLISAPGTEVDRTVVFGVNHQDLTADDIVVSNASCTTNCLAPVAKVLDDAFGIKTGYMTTIHAYTGDQPTHDTTHKDLYRARAAALSMIPTSTGAARAISLVLPHLKGRLEGSAIRVPTPNVSVVDLTFQPERAASVEGI
ncbi:aldehyde dehydrogenase, partial [Rhodobacteraceae bacterium R_SAG5]|nr:aldehyde dehydrogenase [Rhodobacteraceae bacterium R_SAG5]